MLFNEPKLLKLRVRLDIRDLFLGFSALQRAEIAEMRAGRVAGPLSRRCFSALQRAEIAEILLQLRSYSPKHNVSVLFNEPKLLKLS